MLNVVSKLETKYIASRDPVIKLLQRDVLDLHFKVGLLPVVERFNSDIKFFSDVNSANQTVLNPMLRR